MSTRQPIVFAFYGTSLTTGRLSADWVPRILNRLKQEPEAKGPVLVYNMGRGSQTSNWGVDNAYTVADVRPTHILFEDFGINDCAIGPVTLPQAAANFDAMVSVWRDNIPGVYLTHQTMSPAAASDSLRTNLPAYYAQGLSKAAAAGIPSLNHTPDWPPITSANTYGALTDFSAWGGAFDPAAKNANVTLTAGNTTATGNAGVSDYFPVRGTTSQSSGRYYYGLNIGLKSPTGDVIVGAANSSASLATNAYPGIDTNGIGYRSNGAIVYGGSTVATVASWTTGDLIGVAAEAGTRRFWFAKNNVWQNGDPVTGVGGTVAAGSGALFPMASIYKESSVTIAATITGGGDMLHPIWDGTFELYSYPSILAWAKARMAAYAPWQ